MNSTLQFAKNILLTRDVYILVLVEAQEFLSLCKVAEILKNNVIQLIALSMFEQYAGYRLTNNKVFIKGSV